MLVTPPPGSLRVPAVIHTVHGAVPPVPAGSRAEILSGLRAVGGAPLPCLASVADAMTELMVAAARRPREKFTTVYSGMEVEPFLAADQHRAAVRRELGYDDEHVVVGKIARLFHLKGHGDLIAAARSLIAKHPQVRLLVGDGLLRGQLEQRIAAAGMTRTSASLGSCRRSGFRSTLARWTSWRIAAPARRFACDAAASVARWQAGRELRHRRREVVITGQTGFLIRPPSDRRAHRGSKPSCS